MMESDIESGHQTIIKNIKKVSRQIFILFYTHKYNALLNRFMIITFNKSFLNFQDVYDEQLSPASSGSLNGSAVEVPAVIVVDDSEKEEEAQVKEK